MLGEKKDANESDDEYEVERVVDYQFCKETVRRGKKNFSCVMGPIWELTVS